MRSVALFALWLCCAGAVASSAGYSDSNRAVAPAMPPDSAPGDIVVFDLHDPDVLDRWTHFLASTPMLNEEPLPSALQDRLASTVATYRVLTPVDRPAFFVATYFDRLSDRLLSGSPADDGEILPQRVCPVFANGANASVSSLLAVASGLPDAVFANAPGDADRYRYLFLQTEVSHCRFLAAISATVAARPSTAAGPGHASVAFELGARSHVAQLASREELRALVEAVGDADAIAAFTQHPAYRGEAGEADVLRFVRLLALLATDGRNGYAAIPVLLPQLRAGENTARAGEPVVLQPGEALKLAYRVRAVFRSLVPFAIRDTDELLQAKLAVAQALADGSFNTAADESITGLLASFVAGADLLLPPMIVAQQKMPLIGD